MNKISRREFLSKTGKTALAGGAAFGFGSALLSCGPISTNLALEEESPAKFSVFSAVNPNIRSIESYTFADCVSQFYRPGICYKTSKPMVAVARGTVVEIINLRDESGFWAGFGNDPKGAKGFLVRIRHGDNYTSCYLHLEQPKVRFGQEVERGQRIGVPVWPWNIPTLMLLEQANAIDPDKYGINHSFMTYWDGVTDFEIGKKEQEKRVEKQAQLLRKIVGLCSGPEKYTLLMKKHKHGDRVIRWSKIEIFRYIEHVYQENPQKFPSLTKGQLKEMRKEIYDNQPIILTLPFEKG